MVVGRNLDICLRYYPLRALQEFLGSGCNTIQTKNLLNNLLDDFALTFLTDHSPLPISDNAYVNTPTPRLPFRVYSPTPIGNRGANGS